jgi:cation transport regulator ChaB
MKKRLKDEIRLNSECQFVKADMYNNSESSFNQMFKSEYNLPDEIESGLENLAHEFVYKADFLQAVKDNNKVCNRQRDIGSETYQHFVKTCLDNGNLPLPILLKIKKGILYIPSSYSITKGLSLAMKGAMKHLEHIGRNFLSKAIFDNSNMNDEIFANVLSGLRTRSEFMSLNSVNNQIGQKTAE